MGAQPLPPGFVNGFWGSMERKNVSMMAIRQMTKNKFKVCRKDVQNDNNERITIKSFIM